MNAQVIPMNGTPTEATAAARNVFAERIAALWHRSREAILSIGQALIEARDQLPYSEFKQMIYEQLPFGPDTARQFMRIAGDPLLKSQANSPVPVLPAAAETLDTLRKLAPDDFQQAVRAGDIHPRMTVADAKALVGTIRPLYNIAARSAQELRRPIMTETELIATLIGYREADGVPQLAADDEAAFEEGYTGKLEIGTRRAWHESFFSWLAARRLAMILIPAVDAVRADLCPCCRQTVKV